eukprot:4446925-Pyramimonas_sp.AAC.1
MLVLALLVPLFGFVAAVVGRLAQPTGECKETVFMCVPPRCFRCGCQPSYVVAVVVDILPWASGF